MLLIIDHRGVQEHFVYVFADDEDSLVILVSVVILIVLRGRGSCRGQGSR